MTTNENTTANVPALMGEVAAILGSGWSVKPGVDQSMRDDSETPSTTRASLHHEDGREVCVVLNGKYGSGPAGKLHIFGVWPRDAKSGYMNPRDYLSADEREQYATTSINVDPARGAAVIAREITKRLLPTVTYLTAHLLARIAGMNDTRATTQETLQQLIKALPNARETYQSERGEGTYREAHFEGGNVRVCAESITFEGLGVSLDVALRIAAILREEVR